ncbi:MULTISPECIES: hypothetical protein [Acinetobacter]|uniref:hypothetical protein n=1 Tax=Acinetobacter calcoaceticus TaxID=471 RepID=UPI00124D80FA|nr:hypothetical protein [Acinetobacter calcoaceticus]
MKEKILNFIKNMHGNVSFVELQNEFPEIKGSEHFGQESFNLLFWPNVTIDFIEAINSLIHDNKIMFSPCEPILYTGDGVIVDFPVAKEFQKHTSMHWYPMVFSAL